MGWLVATAMVPAVALSLSHHRYSSQAATRLLFNLANANDAMRHAMVGAGAVPALLSIITTDR